MKNIIVSAILSSGITFALICYTFMNIEINPLGEWIHFKSTEGDFYFEAFPAKGIHYKMMERSFSNYKEKNGLSEDSKLCRITRKNYLKVSMWSDYKFKREWNYPLRY